jgi:MbtH protein
MSNFLEVSLTNPFDAEHGTFLALVNDEGQFSLWPADTAVPAGWTRAFGPDQRAACLAHIEAAWVDMRPRSLIDATGKAT